VVIELVDDGPFGVLVLEGQGGLRGLGELTNGLKSLKQQIVN
jgi:hypothetical protein